MKLEQNTFDGYNSLLDTNIKEIRLFLNDVDGLNIELIISNFRSKSIFKTVKLTFIGVVEYSFLWSENYYFYTIENYKFFKTETYCYLSLDPDLTTREISENDMDYIKSKHIELIEL